MTVSILNIPNASVRMHEGTVLFDNGQHRWIWLGQTSDDKSGEEVPANQYIVENNQKACLLDPGSILNFGATVANLARYIDTSRLEYLFFSHQDPDVASGIALWAGCCPARFLMPKVWGRFLPHFGEFDQARTILVPDKGMNLQLGNSNLQIVPAHFLHSLGNIQLYDPEARILFTGDVGAALMPPGEEVLFVEDFRSHIKYMEGFHKRYMISNIVTREWATRMSRLQIDAIVPQHGAIFRGEMVKQFLDWIGNLKCGIDLLQEWYR